MREHTILPSRHNLRTLFARHMRRTGIVCLGMIVTTKLGVRAENTFWQTPPPAPSQPLLQYHTTFLGNSFGGGPNWVQNFIEGMFVAPDGTVYCASGWDEGGREFGFYRNGQVVGQATDTHGWGTGGGTAIVATDRYVFIAHSQGNENGGLIGPQYPPKGKTWFGVSRRSLDGKPAPFAGGRGRFGDMLVLHETEDDAQIRGLASDGKTVYVSDTPDSVIRTFNVETMKPTNRPRFERYLPRCGPLSWTKNGVWAIQNAGVGLREPTRVVHLVPVGAVLPLPPGSVPSGLCATDTGRVYVADSGPAQQIRIFDPLPDPPGAVRIDGDPLYAQKTTWGVDGGIYAGPIPGRNGPLRFAGPCGVGLDAQANLYVGCNPPGGAAVLRAFDSNGHVLWGLAGLEFVDTADAVPGTDADDLYTAKNRYWANWDKGVFGKTAWRARTVDPFTYPDDPRLSEGHHNFCAPLVREFGGKRFLIVRGMFEQALVFYALDKTGKTEIARPSTMLAKGPYQEGRWKNVPAPADGRWFWRDINGDGQFDKNEFFDADGVRDNESWAWWVDEQGNVWQGQQTGARPLRCFPLQGFDRMGNPVYQRSTQKSFSLPPPLNQLLRVEYHAATDTMYLTGYTSERPKTGAEWGMVGTEILRFDRWSRGNRTPTWRIALPYQPETGAGGPGASVPMTVVKAFCTAGDYIFAVEARTARVHVYNAHTGRATGDMVPGLEVGNESGWVDFPDAIRATRRKNGEYLVFVEEDAKGKVIVYRWTPRSTSLQRSKANG